MNELERQKLEHLYHEADDLLRDDNRFLTGLYESGLFDEAETYLLDCLGQVEGVSALDFGCGSGKIMHLLLQRGAIVTGFDLSYSRLEQARRWYKVGTEPSKGNLIQAEAGGLPFSDGSFDVVVGKQILHHIDLEEAAEEVARVLLPGGMAAFLEPLVHNPLLEGYRRLTPHLRSPTEKALSVDQLASFGERFTRWEHREFCLFSVLPMLLATATKPGQVWHKSRNFLQRVDRQLVTAFPRIGRYCWESVIVVYK